MILQERSSRQSPHIPAGSRSPASVQASAVRVLVCPGERLGSSPEDEFADRCLVQGLDRPPAPDVDGSPGWRWRGGPVYVATGDLDQLRFLGVALRHFDRMTAEQLRAYLEG